MKRLALFAVWAVAACRGDHRSVRRDDAPVATTPRDAALPAEVAAPVPHLPVTTDGATAMRALDDAIAAAGADARATASLLLERAAITDLADDVVRALDLARRAAPSDGPAQLVLAQACLRAGRFAEARATLDALERTRSAEVADLAVELARAMGDIEGTLAERARRMESAPDAEAITAYASALADADRVEEAVALIPRAAAAVHETSPTHVARMLVAWGRIYETAGQHASARDLHAEAHRRLPAYVEATEHLALALVQTGDRDGAAQLVHGQTHPALLAIDAKLSGDRSRIEAAGRAWQAYVDTSPLAYCEPAARFWLDIGGDPKRALALALVDRVNRDTARSRALLMEAALAAGDPARACAEVGPLVKRGPRAARYTAWRALVACGRTTEAARLARDLGIN